MDFAFIKILPTATAKMVAILKEEYMSVLPGDGHKRDFVTVLLSSSGDVVRFASVVRTVASRSLTVSKSRCVAASFMEVSGISSSDRCGPSDRRVSFAMTGIAEENEEADDSTPSATVKQPQ